MIKKQSIITSPHLQIYRPQLTSILSISHRFAGGILLSGFVLMAIVFSWALLHPTSYDATLNAMPSWLLSLAFFIVCAAWIYHFLNGIRHLLWDWLIGLDIRQVYASGYIVLVLFALILAGVWL